MFLALKNDKHFLGVHCLQDNIEMSAEQGESLAFLLSIINRKLIFLFYPYLL